jgi:predicted flap endonuclease-1-like 5' DNA nuclease
MFTYWISHFPTAPMFGVEWRYASLFQGTAAEEKPAKAATPTKPKAAKPVATTAAARKTAPEKLVETKPVAETPPAKSEEPVAKANAPVKPAKVTAPKTVMTAPEASPPEPVSAKPAELAKPAPVKAEAPAAKPDDLKLIKGIGPGLEKQLNGLGVERFDQIATMSKSDLQRVDDQLTAFKGRCFRDDWVGQAKTLLAD